MFRDVLIALTFWLLLMGRPAPAPAQLLPIGAGYDGDTLAARAAVVTVPGAGGSGRHGQD